MYTFITEMLESISKKTISSQLHLSEQTWVREESTYTFEMVIEIDRYIGLPIFSRYLSILP